MKKKNSSDIQSRSLRRRAEDKIMKNTTGPEIPVTLSQDEMQHIIHELNIHQIELEMQNEELRETQKQLEITKSRYYNLYNLAPVGYFTISKEGLIIEVNLTASMMLGQGNGSMYRKPLINYITREDRDIYYLHNRKLFKTGLPQECELRMLNENNEAFWVKLNSVLIDNTSNEEVYNTTISNIDTRKQIEKKLAEKDAKLALLFEHLPIGLFITNKDGKIINSNSVLKTITGLNDKELQKRISTPGSFMLSDNTFIEPDDFPSVSTARLKTPVKNFEIGFKWNKTSTTWINVNSVLNVLKSDDWETITTVIDITSSRFAEDKINNLLEEKQTLLEEVHHRMKNNMLTIHSLIMQQISRLTEPQAITALKDTASRVSSMMILYDRLNSIRGNDKISLKDYLPPLIDDIVELFPGIERVSIEKDIDDFIIPEKKLISLGLIISELLTNIMKFAFIGRENGLITVSARFDSDSQNTTIVIQDNVSGISEDINSLLLRYRHHY
jgi:PAS domain S-box-containing protein